MLMMRRCRAHRAGPRRVSYLTVILVGLGSIGFHGTLQVRVRSSMRCTPPPVPHVRAMQFELQMLDELPMLWTALVVVYTLVEDKPERRYGNWFPALLFLHAVFITALVSMTHGALQFYLFHISFGTAEFYSLYRVFRMYNAVRCRTCGGGAGHRWARMCSPSRALGGCPTTVQGADAEAAVPPGLPHVCGGGRRVAD